VKKLSQLTIFNSTKGGGREKKVRKEKKKRKRENTVKNISM
jgi:hypothetical protein